MFTLTELTLLRYADLCQSQGGHTTAAPEERRNALRKNLSPIFWDIARAAVRDRWLLVFFFLFYNDHDDIPAPCLYALFSSLLLHLECQVFLFCLFFLFSLFDFIGSYVHTYPLIPLHPCPGVFVLHSRSMPFSQSCVCCIVY